MTLDRNAEKQEVPVNPETGKPYINTLAAVAISPAGASPEKSTYVAQAVDVIRESGLPNETNAMFTNIEGDIDDVLKVSKGRFTPSRSWWTRFCPSNTLS